MPQCLLTRARTAASEKWDQAGSRFSSSPISCLNFNRQAKSAPDIVHRLLDCARGRKIPFFSDSNGKFRGSLTRPGRLEGRLICKLFRTRRTTQMAGRLLLTPVLQVHLVSPIIMNDLRFPLVTACFIRGAMIGGLEPALTRSETRTHQHQAKLEGIWADFSARDLSNAPK
jgi:hypothetical protein